MQCVVLPGGFSYGDYLRCGAIARFAPIMKSVVRFANDGGLVLGICNGFQILCEAHLLPGALMRNRSLSFICERVNVRVENAATPFTCAARQGEVLRLPIKHGEGLYVAPADELRAMEERGQVLLRYIDAAGRERDDANPNGSTRAIAGVANETFNVFGLMPHPEHAVEAALGGEDGLKIFRSIVDERRADARRSFDRRIFQKPGRSSMTAASTSRLRSRWRASRRSISSRRTRTD